MAYSTGKEIGCIAFVIVLLLAPLATLYNAFVMLNLYNWFILPTWKEAPVLSWMTFIGVSLMCSLILAHLARESTNSDGEKKEFVSVCIEAIIKAFATPTVMLFIGWVYQMLWMR